MRGLIGEDQLLGAVRQGYYWESRSRLLCLENTLNKAGGVIYPFDRLQALTRQARELGLATHLDGARLWNASVATGTPERTYADLFDTVTVCLSKGLGAPAGSIFAGTHAHVKKAHRRRKMLGAGMRQVGILAAAGLYALRHHRNGLAEDHAKARRLAEGLANMDMFDVQMPDTNIVLFDVRSGPALPFLTNLQQAGVAMVPFGPHTIRATTHRDVTMADIDRALELTRRTIGPAG